MKRPIDTLFYQWVLDEDDKEVPTVFEDVSNMDKEEKVGALLEVFSNLVVDVVETEMAQRTLVDLYAEKAAGDPEVAEQDIEDVIETIETLPDVEEAIGECDAASRRLDLFSHSLMKVLTSEMA